MRYFAELHVSDASSTSRMGPTMPARIFLTPGRVVSYSVSASAAALVGPRGWASVTSSRNCRVLARYPDVPELAMERVKKSPPPQIKVIDEVPSMEDLQEILSTLTPKQLVDAIRSFAKQGLSPSDDLMAVIAVEVKSKLELFKSQDLSNTVWSLAVLKYNPDSDWWNLFERQVYTNITEFNSRELANLMWALAILEYQPAFILESMLSHAQDGFATCSANTLHLMIWSIGKLGHTPNQEWMDKFLSATQASFFQFTPNEMSNIIWALAKLGHKLPSMWIDNFLMVAQWRFPSFSAKLLSVVVWSVAMLEHKPSQEWLLSFEAQIREKFDDFNGQELTAVAWALRKLGNNKEQNAVFYNLRCQDHFLEVDFDILCNPKLLGQVLSLHSSDSGAWDESGPSSASNA